MSAFQIGERQVVGKPLGRHVNHDARSRDFPYLGSGLLHAVLWHRAGLAFNQGELGSCTGNALCGALNTDPLHRPRERLKKEADAVKVYEAATLIDPFPGSYPPTDTGSSGLAVCKVAKRLGWISSYRHCFSLTSALTALMHGPVITGVNWYEGFDTPDSHGTVRATGEVRGGHEFEVVGYDPATDLVVAWNSWGPSWGVHGRFRFHSSTWARLLGEAGDVTVPVRAAA